MYLFKKLKFFFLLFMARKWSHEINRTQVSDFKAEGAQFTLA